MSDYAWVGVLISAGGTTLALASWFVMAVPYIDNAPYLTDLRKNSRLATLIGLVMFVSFFALFYYAAQVLDQDNSGPLIAFMALVDSLPVCMLLGTETWDRYNPKGMNHVPGLQAVAVATGIGLAELAGAVGVFMLLYHLN